MADLFDPDVELHGTVGGLEEGKIVRGLEQIVQAFDAEFDEAWDEHRIEPQEFIDAGDRVVILHREYQRSKSGVELVIDTATILDVRDGRIVRMQGYMNPAEARPLASPRRRSHRVLPNRVDRRGSRARARTSTGPAIRAPPSPRRRRSTRARSCRLETRGC